MGRIRAITRKIIIEFMVQGCFDWGPESGIAIIRHEGATLVGACQRHCSGGQVLVCLALNGILASGFKIPVTPCNPWGCWVLFHRTLHPLGFEPSPAFFSRLLWPVDRQRRRADCDQRIFVFELFAEHRRRQ